MTTVSDRIIDALGGTTAVSRKAETPLSTVHSWRRNGIPSSRLAHLKLIAAAELVSIDWITGERLDHDATDTAPGICTSSNSSCQIIGQVSA
ncbi:carph-isopro domain-containing protein [Sphingomonas paucimobilis]|uniref:carph-isopro domain-containing protein n=1 Tax=Sphingomonas paucimobilis TaxID=13689 RepID=UPI00064BF5E3